MLKNVLDTNVKRANLPIIKVNTDIILIK